jgi:hypothetical protein
MLLTRIELVQLVQFKLVELVQPRPVYIFCETFKQATLVAQTWPQIVDNLISS